MDINTLYSEYVNKFHVMNCLEFVKQLPDNCLDFVVTSPPYNLGNKNMSEDNNLKQRHLTKGELKNTPLKKFPKYYHEGYDMIKDALPYSIYCEQQNKLLQELIRCIKPHGAIYYNIKLRYYNGEVDRLNKIFYNIPIRQIIRWDKGSTLFIHDNYYNCVSENVYLITKNESTFKLDSNGYNLTDTWRISRQIVNVGDHPAIFPIEFVKQCLSYHVIPHSETKPLVYDPYMGSGTTAIAAHEMGFDFIGTDISEKYVKNSQIRFLNNEKVSETMLYNKNIGFQKTLLGGSVKNSQISHVKINKIIQ